MHKTAVELSKSAGRALSALYNKFIHFGGMSFDVYCEMYHSLIEPVLFYGAEVWGLSKFREIQVIQNKACRYFLGVSRNASNIATQGDMGWYSCHSKQKISIARFYCHISNMAEDRLPKKIFNWSKRFKSSWASRAETFLRANDIDTSQMLDKSSVLNVLRTRLHDNECTNWQKELWNDAGRKNGNKLRTYRLYKQDLQSEPYVTTNLPRAFRRTLASFRCGSLPLRIETGRYQRPPLEVGERICVFCNLAVEDEAHFLLNCELYSDLRDRMFCSASNHDPGFAGMTDNEKLKTLMATENLQYVVAKTIHKMFNRRRHCEPYVLP